MPGFDGQGPAGPRPGRGLGPCGRYPRRGYGWRDLELSKEEQKKILEAEKQAIENKLSEL
jgi:hypothetical protein